MLVLGRKAGQEILIGNSIRLVVLGIRGSQVRLGFDAPDDVTIKRTEILSRGELPGDSPDEHLLVAAD
jgi:carbon storage regulator